MRISAGGARRCIRAVSLMDDRARLAWWLAVLVVAGGLGACWWMAG
jgi:hypothetical protein